MTTKPAIELLKALENGTAKFCIYDQRTGDKTEVGIIEEDDDGDVVCY
jgi:hypothetical protein